VLQHPLQRQLHIAAGQQQRLACHRLAEAHVSEGGDLISTWLGHLQRRLWRGWRGWLVCLLWGGTGTLQVASTTVCL
jgi:hypothetical protein